MSTAMQNQTTELGTQPVGKLLFKLSMPAIAAQIINLLYNVVDRMYIGHMDVVGRDALTGVGVCLPLLMIITAFASLVGAGGSPRASIFLGKGDKDMAEKTLGNSVSVLLIFSVTLTLIFQFFAEDMLMLFGASENTIGYALDYILIYSLGTVFVQMTLGLNAYITAQGFANTSMLTVLIGAVLNIILDPIFIFVFDMGVKGAATATIISQCASMIWILCFLTGKKTTLKIKIKNLKLDPKVFLPCLGLGMGVFIMQSTESLLAICFNASLYRYGGDVAVGSMTILSSVMQASMLPIMGLGQGAQPIISYNYGATKPSRVRRTMRLLLVTCLAYSITLWIAVEAFPLTFIKIFNDDPALVEFSIPALRLYMLGTGLFGAQLACQQGFISIGYAKSSLTVAIVRKIILLIPLIYILPLLPFNMHPSMAVLMAEPIADTLSILFTVILFSIQFKKAIHVLDEKSDSEHNFGLSYRFARWLVRTFCPKMKTIWEEPFRGNPSIFACNHDRAYGPVAMCAYFDLKDTTRPWINDEVLSAKTLPAYVREDYWWPHGKWYTPILDYTLAYIYAALLPPILRGSDSIAVRHDAGTIATLHKSLKYLKDGMNLMLFPELPNGYNTYSDELYEGFVSLGKLCYRKNKSLIDFYPVYIDWKAHEIRVGKAIAYDPEVPLPDFTKKTCDSIKAHFKNQGK